MVALKDTLAAKWNIQNKMTSDDFIILNFNQDLAKELATQTNAQVVPFSTCGKSRWCLSEIKMASTSKVNW